jgi:hypothetical protein
VTGAGLEQARPGEGGVLYALGNGNAGLSVFVQDDRLVFDHNAFGEHTVVESDVEVPVGPSTLGVRLRRAGNRADTLLVVDDQPVGRAGIPFAMRVISSVGSSVGHDHGMPVSGRYDSPFPFEGVLHTVDIQLSSASDHHGRDAAAPAGRAAMGRQ